MKQAIFSSIIGGILIVAAIVVYALSITTQAASIGAGYYAKHYDSTNASSTIRTIAFGGMGELGSITVNTTSAKPIYVFDAASTTAATSTLTKIAEIKASVAEQTFTYEVNVRNGVTLEIPAGYAGDITVAVR